MVIQKSQNLPNDAVWFGEFQFVQLLSLSLSIESGREKKSLSGFSEILAKQLTISYPSRQRSLAEIGQKSHAFLKVSGTAFLSISPVGKHFHPIFFKTVIKPAQKNEPIFTVISSSNIWHLA